MKRFVIIAVAGIALLLAGSLAFIEWLGDRRAPEVAGDPAPVATSPTVAPSGPPARGPVVTPPAGVAPEVKAFVDPPTRPVPPPPEPAPVASGGVDGASLQAIVSQRCGQMQVRLGDAMRARGEEMKGQALLLFDAEPLDGKVRVGQGRLQSPGNVRPGLVACAQLALKGQVVEAAGIKPGERFTLQVVLGMKP